MQIHSSSFFTEYWVVFVILVLILFGSKKLPHIARWLGQIIGEYMASRREQELNIEIKKSADSMQREHRVAKGYKAKDLSH